MKLSAFLLIATLVCSQANASEGITVDFLFSIKQEKVPAYVSDTSRETPFIVWMNFNGDTIMNKDIIGRLRYVVPERIDLVYTDFRRSQTFDQPELNKKRLETLHAAVPQLFRYEMTDWRFFGQTAGGTADSAMKMFHGFVVYPKKEVKETRTELSFIRMALDSAIVYAGEYDSNCVVMRTQRKTHYVPTGKYVSRQYFYHGKGEPSDVRTKKYYIPQKEKTYTFVTRYDTVKCYKSSYIDPRVMQMVTDSTVIKVFERNSDWENKLVVADITGSMSPYTSQLAIWFKLRENLADVEQFVFFNDGDDTPDYKKVIGRTGGIYSCPGGEGFGVMYETLKQAMMRGCGGDIPENNIEALISGISNCADCDEVILIADNWAPVKDISLLKSISKPVRIVLCGSEMGIFNSDYLEIARSTGGSIHTLEKDITDLVNMNEGERVVIGKREYVITNGKFEMVKSL